MRNIEKTPASKRAFENPDGTFAVTYFACGSNVIAGPDTYADPKFGMNYMVREESFGKSLSENEIAYVRGLCHKLLEMNPKRTIRISVEQC